MINYLIALFVFAVCVFIVCVLIDRIVCDKCDQDSWSTLVMIAVVTTLVAATAHGMAYGFLTALQHLTS